MTSSDQPPLRLTVTSDVAVRITVYGATGSKLGVGHGNVMLSLLRGLYRVHLERCGVVRELFIDHDRETALHDPGPPLHTPAPLAGAATSHAYYSEPARTLSLSDTCRPLGDGPHSGRLFIFIRRKERKGGPPRVPSEPVTIHDLTGRKLAVLDRDTTQSGSNFGYIAFSGRVTPGTYRIRAAHSRRELAITIPHNRTAHVFIADSGTVRLDDLRVALVELGRPFDPEGPVARAMESVLAALRSPELAFPPDARVLLPEAVDQDLCFGIASAHQLWRCQDYSTFDQVVQRLKPYADLPDVAALSHSRPAAGSATPTPFEAPPLMRASLVMAMTRPEPELSTIVPDSVFARATAAGLHDSIWCTWGTRVWDEQWIEPTVESLRDRGEIQPASIARMLGLPPRTVERSINDLDSRLPLVGGSPVSFEHLRIPGYALGELLGRGLQGTVFRATRMIDGQVVALKILPLTGDRKKRATIEFYLAGRFSHPGLLSYNHWGVLDGALWFDMELCRGSVFDLVSASNKSLPFDQTCEIVLQALNTLVYLHGEGVIHGNIKPTNLLVRADGSAALTDLGLTRGLLHDGQIVVTSRTADATRFLPRERLIDVKHSTPASDIWSMAATLYFLLTLELPRDEYADQSALEVGLKNPVVPIAERWAKIPGDLARCIDRALSDDIHVRSKDGAQLRTDLMTALALHSLRTRADVTSSVNRVYSTDSAQSTEETEALNTSSSLSEFSSDSLRPARRRNLSRERTQDADYRSASLTFRGQGYRDIRRGRITSITDEWPTDPLADDAAVGSLDRAPLAHLRILTGQPANAVHVFPPDGASVGRVGGGCDVTIDDARMSRRHARIARGITGWRLQDLVSRSGGFVDGLSFGTGERMALTDGSIIRLGETLMVFRTSAPTSDGRADSPVFPGISSAASAVRKRIDSLAAGTGHVLILGEIGTGKAHVAKAIGEHRAPHPFMPLNSAELLRDPVRTGLFERIRRAFSRTVINPPGLVDIVEDGVWFIDEIGELSLDVQAELLRFLENGSYRALGSTKLRHSNARVIATTHVDLDQAIQDNQFRRDLLARLRASNVPLELPPLRERREDILGWTQLFLRQANRDAGPGPWTVSALECLLLYPWAENLRALESIVVEAATQSESFPRGIESLPATLRAHLDTLRELPSLDHHVAMAVPASARSGPTQSELEEALRRTRGRVRIAAQQLGIDRRQLYQLCERFGIALEAFRTDLPPEDE